MRQKKEQIRSVIEKTGYQPSAQARILRTKKASLVGIVVPKINSESISRATAGIEKILSEQNYQMLLAGTDNTPAKAFNDDRVGKGATDNRRKVISGSFRDIFSYLLLAFAQKWSGN